jgi:L-fuculose-phosphate aldolase
MSEPLPAQRAELMAAMEEAQRQDLNRGTAGNLSLRTDIGMLITPTGIPVDRLSPDMMVSMHLDGAWSGDWRPSSEWAMHAAIYQAFPRAAAIVHAHPDHCVALSCLRIALPAFHYMVASFGGDDVPCAEYAPFGSMALAQSTVAALRDRTACLLANHGMICFASRLSTAVAQAAKLEMLARQFWIARSIGAPVMLDSAQMEEVIGRYQTYGQQPTRTDPAS